MLCVARFLIRRFAASTHGAWRFRAKACSDLIRRGYRYRIKLQAEAMAFDISTRDSISR